MRRTATAAVFFGLLFFALPAFAASTITPKSCSAADLNAAIGKSKPGDIIAVPAGDCVIDNSQYIDITDKSISLVGDGRVMNPGTPRAVWQGSTTLRCRSHNCIVLKNKIGNPKVRVSGLHIVFETGTESLIYNEAWNFEIDNSLFESEVLCNLYNIGQTKYQYYATGVYHDNVFKNCRMLLRGETDGSREEWAQPSTIGNPDQRYVYYVENNAFFFTVFGNCFDQEFGSRLVFRKNYVQNVYGEVHGVHEIPPGYDGLPGLNGRSWEYYDNVFKCQPEFAGKGQCYAPLRLRGGTGVVFNNSADGYDIPYAMDNQRSEGNGGPPNGTCNGRSRWDGNRIGGWPCVAQIGTGAYTAGKIQPQALEPAYFWNNTFKGQPMKPTVLGGGSIRDIKEGRDWFPTPRPNYTPYPYPYQFPDGKKPPTPGARD